ncbi:MFS transporter [Caballeronia hypogeia]|uniref:MFS transporter n=2 Tax=Caballeronia hypogeia TaxID=1777140 RepID=A0A158DDC3_9BURK|nr:MFS transporter [Caballeronia hypogeia]
MFGSFLGLLAILMVTLAPVVSRSLDATRNNAGDSGMHCSMPSMQHDHAQTSKLHASMHDAGDACGYCSLFAHMPAVITPPRLFAQIVEAVQQRRATRFESVRLVKPLNPGQPRAPPLLRS